MSGVLYFLLARFSQLCDCRHWRHELEPCVKRFAAIVGLYELANRIALRAFPSGYSWVVSHINIGVSFYLVVVVCAAVYALWRFLPKLKVVSVIQGSNVSVTIAAKELLAQKGDLALACNTTFDTHSVNGFVKPKSLQWDFQHKFFPELDELDNQIEEALKFEEPTRIYKKRKKSKRKNYQVGTVAHVRLQKYGVDNVYLLALSNSHPEGGSITSFEAVQKSIECLWRKVSMYGPVKRLSVPVFGTGQAGVKESAMIIIKEIVRSFVAASRNERVIDSLQICIHPKDLWRMRIDFYDLEQFVRVHCASQLPVPTQPPRDAIELEE